MLRLSLQKLPHYVFSSNRQFNVDEKHICRIYDMSVLILMRKGVLRFSESGVPIELKKGEYYIQRPNLLQEGVVPSDQPNYYFIHFNGHYSEDGSLPIRGTFDIDEIQKIIDKFDSLKDSAEKIEKEILFYEILTSLKSNVINQSIPEKIRDYILDNYSKDIRLEDLCEISFLSKNQTINIFRNTYGITPHRFLIKTRLKKACELIISTDEAFKTICYSVGFSDYTNFYKLFCQEYGLSPNEYREKISSIPLPEDLYKFPEEESGITLDNK